VQCVFGSISSQSFILPESELSHKYRPVSFTPIRRRPLVFTTTTTSRTTTTIVCVRAAIKSLQEKLYLRLGTKIINTPPLLL
jgi:hypothetical protein